MLLQRFLRNKTLLATMLLSIAMPSFARTARLAAAPTGSGENQTLTTGVYQIVNDKRQPGSNLHVYVDGNGSLRGQTFSTIHQHNLMVLY